MGNNAKFASCPESKSGKYLFCYFVGNKPEEERIHFAVSEDGYNFTALNNNQPVIIQTLGKKCVRDPYIFRADDGTYYIVGTDMKSEEGWTSNHALVSWKSENLVDWTDETIIDMRDFGGDLKNTNRAWAPQVIKDSSNGKYMVYFALSTKENDTAGMYYSYTQDFKTITKPEPLYLREGIQTIDGDIVYNEKNGYYYMYFKHDEDQTIAYVKSSVLTGPYEDKPVVVSLSEHGVEGSLMYNITGTDFFVMIMDEYGTDHYFAQGTSDMESFLPINPKDYDMDSFSPRHASVIPISDEEYERLINRYGK